MKAEIKIIEDQKTEISDNCVDNYEAEQLLRKYGYESSKFTTRYEEISNDQSLTFEQMVNQKQLELQIDQEKIMKRFNGPKPITFDSKNGYDYEVKYRSDDDSGFNFKIEVVSDMVIPK